MDSLKILIAGDPSSIHTSRFTCLLQDLGHQVRIFQCAYNSCQDEHLHDTIIYTPYFNDPPINGNVLKATYPFEYSYSWLMSLVHLGKRFACLRFKIPYTEKPRSRELASIIRKWRPQVIFSLKMQNDGYTVSETKQIMGIEFCPKWIHFNWGTDIEFFGKHPEYAPTHLPKIKAVLSSCAFHVADCYRDVRQAKEYGFKGTSLGFCLANGGYDLGDVQKIIRAAGNERKYIVVKGREGGYVGRAFNVLAALHKAAEYLSDYKIIIIMPTEDVKGAAQFLVHLDKLNIEVMGRLSYQHLLSIYAQSIMAISASDVDGTPSFLTEAMVMGAFPIHSDMESVREWIHDGENGLLFPVDDIQYLSKCIISGLTDSKLIENAREINWKIAQERMDRNKIKNTINGLLARVMQEEI